MRSFFLLAAAIVFGAGAAALLIGNFIGLLMVSRCEMGETGFCGGLGQSLRLALMASSGVPGIVAFYFWLLYQQSRTKR